MIPAERLRRLRNDLPMALAIAALGRDGPPSKVRDGRFVFLFPHSGEMLADVNPTVLRGISPEMSRPRP